MSNSSNKIEYIANQGDHDEVRFILETLNTRNNHGNSMPIVLAGPPACGKSQAVETVQKNIWNT